MIRIQLDSDGIGDYLKSEQGGLAAVVPVAERLAAKAGDGYTAETWKGRTRSGARVRAESIEARIDNSEKQTLLRLVGGG